MKNAQNPKNSEKGFCALYANIFGNFQVNLEAILISSKILGLWFHFKSKKKCCLKKSISEIFIDLTLN